MNFFLVSQTLLMAAFSNASKGGPPSRATALTLAVLGVVLAILWVLGSYRQLLVVSHLQSEAEEAIPKYKALRQSRPKCLAGFTNVMAYCIPSIILVAWVVLSAVAL